MPKRALTAIAVERIKPPAKGQVEIFDRGYPGLAPRVSYGGGKAWAMFYRHGGKLRRRTLGLFPAMGLAEAREAWRETRKLVAMGQDPARVAVKTSDTVNSVIEDWLKRDKRDAKASSLYQTRSAISRDVLPAWGGARSSPNSKARRDRAARQHHRRGAPGKVRSAMLIYTASLSGRWAGRSSPPVRWTASSARSPPLAEIACCQTSSSRRYGTPPTTVPSAARSGF